MRTVHVEAVIARPGDQGVAQHNRAPMVHEVDAVGRRRHRAPGARPDGRALHRVGAVAEVAADAHPAGGQKLHVVESVRALHPEPVHAPRRHVGEVFQEPVRAALHAAGRGELERGHAARRVPAARGEPLERAVVVVRNSPEPRVFGQVPLGALGLDHLELQRAPVRGHVRDRAVRERQALRVQEQVGHDHVARVCSPHRGAASAEVVRVDGRGRGGRRGAEGDAGGVAQVDGAGGVDVAVRAGVGVGAGDAVAARREHDAAAAPVPPAAPDRRSDGGAAVRRASRRRAAVARGEVDGQRLDAPARSTA